MTLSLASACRPLQGCVKLPGDKSLAHRAALFAALAEGVSTVRNYPDSGVTRAMRGALESLGVTSRLEGGVLTLAGKGFRPFARPCTAVWCGNSATTIRLLAGALAGTRSSAVLDGSEGLRRRPMDRIAEPLRLMGADVATTDGRAPITISPAPLHGIDYILPVASAHHPMNDVTQASSPISHPHRCSTISHAGISLSTSSWLVSFSAPNP